MGKLFSVVQELRHPKVESDNAEKKRKLHGFNMMELVFGMVILAILMAIAVGGALSARDQAQLTSVQNDLKVYESSIRQMLVQYPNIMKYSTKTSSNGKNVSAIILEKLNSSLEQEWHFSGEFKTAGGSTPQNGAIAYTTTKRDAWGNPYGLYIYTDDLTSTYIGKDGKPLKDDSSQFYFVVASAGKNSSGVIMGSDGTNFDEETNKIDSQAKAVNNTDGIDDVGLIVRILNSDVASSTFGFKTATLGDMSNIRWIFGVPKDTKGTVVGEYSVSNSDTLKSASIDQYSSLAALEKAIAGASADTAKDMVDVGNTISKASGG